MSARWLLAVPFLAAMILLGHGAGAQSAPAAYKVIVHASNPVTALSKAQVTQFFLKTKKNWEDGQQVLPVDLSASSPVRAAFSKEILGKSVAAVKSHWQQQIFSGRDVPPPEQVNDALVVAYVATNPGAIGYVAAGVTTAGAKTVVLEP